MKPSGIMVNYQGVEDGVYSSKSKNALWNFILPVLVLLGLSFIIGNFAAFLKGQWDLGVSLSSLGILTAVFTPLMIIPLLGVKTKTTVNLNTREVEIKQKNFKGRKATRTFPIDDLRVNAVRMGATPDPGTGASTRERWIVKAGFEYENFDWSVYSQETTSLEECESAMLDIYHFFFPSRTSVDKNNILTNGNQAYVLTGEEKEEFLRAQRSSEGE